MSTPRVLAIWQIAMMTIACDGAARCAPGTREIDGACVALTSDAAIGEDAGAPLPTDVHVIDGIGREGSAAAYSVIDQVVGDATYVGLGESVHTVGGYYLAKQRLIRHLVEELGFRALAIESPWQAADEVGRYLERCEGEPAAPVQRGLFGVWASDELADVVRWMCEWNAAHPSDRVVFYGFDHQQPWDDGEGLAAFLASVAGDQADGLTEGYATCHCARASSASRCDLAVLPSRESHTACVSGLDAIEAWLAAHEGEIVGASSAEELAVARIRVAGLRGWELEMFHGDRGTQGPEPDVVRSFEGRDVGMAYILRAMRELRSPGQRVIVWAHNTHLAMQQHRVRGRYGGGRSMGTLFHEALGDAYVAIALIGYEVEINWPGIIAPAPPSDDSLEAALHALGRPYVFVDLTEDDAGRVVQPGLEFRMGGEHLVPAEQFRGVFFLDHAPAMHALGW